MALMCIFVIMQIVIRWTCARPQDPAFPKDPGCMDHTLRRFHFC